jgi:hypothetical protein
VLYELIRKGHWQNWLTGRPRRRVGDMKSNSTAIECSCRVESHRPELRTRKGLNWTPRCPAIGRAISWSQVRSGLNPSRFTVRTAPIHRSRAWSDDCESERSLDKAHSWLSRAAVG